MGKRRHEIRDPIHSFITFDDEDRALINSGPMQRLKHIRQLAMTYQVYPGAAHNRFEHSLGVMEFACRVFDAVTAELSDRVRERLEPYRGEDLGYWRKVTRFGALLHDTGHLPLSHAAEGLLPKNWDHERFTAAIIRGPEISGILQSMQPPVDPEHVVDICWEPSKRARVEGDNLPNPWLSLLNEMITGDVLGADRMDYLVRDSHHAGVPYGRFGPDRLIGGMRITIDPSADVPALGLDVSAIHSAEGLLLARHFMYSSVYYHDVRRAYDIHLTRFLKAALPTPGNTFPNTWPELQKWTDDEVFAMMRESLHDPNSKGHHDARRILRHDHFKTAYEWLPAHTVNRATILEDIRTFCDEYDRDEVVYDSAAPRLGSPELWIVDQYGQTVDFKRVSAVMQAAPSLGYGYVFAHPDRVADVRDAIRSEFRAALGGGTIP